MFEENDNSTKNVKILVVERPHRTILTGEIIPKDNSTGNGGDGNKGIGGTTFLGLDTTYVLIVFLIVVFTVLILFLLLYHFVIKRMRQKSISKIAQKSASGSIADERARNIFAHPERQLAVDQSTRVNPNSPASGSDLSEQQQTG